MSKKITKKKWHGVNSAVVIGFFVIMVAGALFVGLKIHKAETPPPQYKVHTPASFHLSSQKHICAVGQSSGCYQRNGDSFPGVGGGWQYIYSPVNTHMTVGEAYSAISNSITNAGYYVRLREDSDFQEGRVSMYAPGRGDQRVNIMAEINTQNANEIPTMTSTVRDIEVKAYE